MRMPSFVRALVGGGRVEDVRTHRRLTRRLRSRCEKLVADLDIPDPFDLPELLRTASRTRGRPIIVVPLAMPAAGPSGAWIKAGKKDYILVERRTSRPHRENIVLHEFAHMYCGHRGPHELERAQAMFPDLNPQVVLQMLTRSAYDDVQEQEAELVAALIRVRSTRWLGEARWTVPDEVSDLVDRIERVLNRPDESGGSPGGAS